MSQQPNGELEPVGGGDPIPLERETLTIGRRDSCDICLRFQNVSSRHAELSFRNGYWYIRDNNSTNGIKVNGVTVQEKVLQPGDEVTIGKRHRFTIKYQAPAGQPAPVEQAREEPVMGKSLLEKAGLKSVSDLGGEDDEEDRKRRAYELDAAELRKKKDEE